MIINHQMVMIGYSDSAKDAGFMSANWAQYRAQEELTAIARLAPFIHINNAEELIEEFNKAIFHIDRNANFKILFSDLSFIVHRLIRVER